MKKSLLLFVLMASMCAGLSAQMDSLTYGEDYTVGQLIQVTTVKVAPNRIQHYLAGISKTWVPAMQVGQEMGLNAGHTIWVSELADGGEFNITLVVSFDSMEQREKGNDPKIAAEFQRKVEQKISEDENFRMTEGYTQIREITGEYLMREVSMK